ncbi:glycosyltransferase [Novosphingobium sp. KCTC 2891]|uniref:glycosyltransferase n=1 Tax=Novosphingobium sp. KCTC 2891 TaxID=2989730 RepID=UPI0022214468|nr:glycosyltransferase [Novosphingobium sp. KCTC 2891]MCW1383121.1 glycosyltransferase [Novosphingobium sp. KCTC 2891]
MSRPVFFDPTGQRHRWTRRAALAALALLIALAAVFATTLATVPAAQPLPLGFERMAPLPLKTQVSRLSHRLADLFGHRPTAAVRGKGAPITVGFYTSWTDGSAEVLARHVGQLDWVAPTLMSIDHAGQLTVTDDAPMRRVLAGALHRPLVVPVLQNAANGTWDGAGTTAVLTNSARRAALVAGIDAALDRSGDNGVMIDFENLPPNGIAALRTLAADLHARFAPKHRVVAVTMPIDSPEWSARDLARVADKVVLMAYDEHWQGGQPGPIASQGWFAGHLADQIKGVARDKVIVALGNYGYDWHEGHADSQTVEEAWLAAHDSGAVPAWDKASGNLGFAYTDNTDHGPVRHDVWMLDAAASWNQMQVLSHLGLGNVALWRLGSEDPGFWPTLKSWRGGGHTPPNLSAIAQANNVDVEGNGEILRVDATPRSGARTIAFDPRSHLVTAENYTVLPTPYVVRRTGDRAKLVALTFDDGPDAAWTPKILSVLERYHVPGTFFVVGENGVGNRSLLERMAADGDEIGNHSYTHPNMADESTAGVKLELNATQRLIEAYTGRSTRLFRAPYFGDAEPTTADELGPALIAQQQGYTVVGLHADTNDWKKKDASAIVDAAVRGIENATPDRTANVVLLHDGGGNREQTLIALPQIIERLEADGYRLVPVSTLAGLKRDDVMPVVNGWDLVAVRADVAIFGILATVFASLVWIFFFAIALGTIRAVGMTVLALIPNRHKAPAPGGADPIVTVIIPAFNEERVIESSIRRILASDYGPMQVIVADDGSKDRTSAIVTEAFGNDPRVRLLTLVNGGKAKALNRALAEASGEIVVALDADTQFEPGTIAKLVRWFVDDRIGAVAGNAKVGNRVNLVTRWQAIEYVTAQNIERRALTRFDAIMVVPGAVGAWRRSALDAVGGFPEDTLAEDQDLTIAIQREGWRIAYDEDAVAWTEAPETLRALGKQRFRWAFGTLQCLWKHRSIMTKRRPSGLAFVGMPQAWLFQIVFAMVSPLIDLALGVSIIGTVIRVVQHGWAQTQTDVLRMGLYWAAFTTIDVLCGWVAFRLDVREERFRPGLLLAQRFVYRQLMYGVVIRAVGAALAGLGIGWGKLERTGRVASPSAAQGQPQGSDQPALT